MIRAHTLINKSLNHEAVEAAECCAVLGANIIASKINGGRRQEIESHAEITDGKTTMTR